MALAHAVFLACGWAYNAGLKSTCSSVWSGKINEAIVTSSPTVVNGQLYVGSADNSFPENISGRIYVFALP